MLTSKGDLAAAEIAFFAPALCISSFVMFRHGLRLARNLGWLYLVTLSLLRLIGASCTLYMETQKKYTTGLYEAAFITSAIGTAPLLLALMGFLERIHQGMEHKGISLMVFRPLHLASLAGLIIAIIGGTDLDESGKYNTGKSLFEAASIIFFAIYLGLAVITIYTVSNTRWVLATEKKLLQAGLLALPFLLVRLIYTVAVAFSPSGSVFNFLDVNVYISAFMQFMMEAIVVSIFIFAGLLTPKMVKHELKEGSKDVESMSMGAVDGPAQESGRMPAREQAPRPQQQQSRSLGDYRPSRLIMSAIRDRQ